jgi:hypothetical protein
MTQQKMNKRLDQTLHKDQVHFTINQQIRMKKVINIRSHWENAK